MYSSTALADLSSVGNQGVAVTFWHDRLETFGDYVTLMQLISVSGKVSAYLQWYYLSNPNRFSIVVYNDISGYQTTSLDLPTATITNRMLIGMDWSATGFRVYVNGLLIKTIAWTSYIETNTADRLSMGDGTGSDLNYTYDNLRFFNRSLNADEHFALLTEDTSYLLPEPPPIITPDSFLLNITPLEPILIIPMRVFADTAELSISVGVPFLGLEPIVMTIEALWDVVVVNPTTVVILITPQEVVVAFPRVVLVDTVAVDIFPYEPTIFVQTIIAQSALPINITLQNVTLIYDYSLRFTSQLDLSVVPFTPTVQGVASYDIDVEVIPLEISLPEIFGLPLQPNAVAIKVTPLLWSYVGGLGSGDDTEHITVSPPSINMSIFVNYISGFNSVYVTPQSLSMVFEPYPPTLAEIVTHPQVSLRVVLHSHIAITNTMVAREKRVHSLGGVVFDYPLYWEETLIRSEYFAMSNTAINGDLIMSVTPARQWSQSYGIFTKNDIIVSSIVVDQLKADVDTSEKLLVFTDGSTQIVKYDFSVKPLVVDMITCDWYYLNIRVIF